MTETAVAPSIIRGKAYVVGDNIDTDQIIPAQYLSLVPTVPEEYLQLGGYALSGLPRDKYPTRMVQPGEAPSTYSVVIAGRNFGCGA
jgi:3-isopropylmalate/(R)-2-methylmalate dehydratase small subunit